jgi:hypothetical protein
MDGDNIGLELSSSRCNSYNDLTTLTNEFVKPINTTSSPIFEEFMFENKLLVPVSPNKKLTRPVSYSDSFLVCSINSGIGNKKGSNQSLALLEDLAQPFLVRDVSGISQNTKISGIWHSAKHSVLREPEVQKPKESQVINKLISITVHVSLISVFENIFFWQFISKSEDTALQTTIDSFLQTTLSSCQNWGNATQIIRDLFDIFVNQTQINNQAILASSARNQTNYTLFVQSWIYYVSLISLVIISAIITYCKNYRIKWKEVALDNIMLVVLLGIYEFTFFKTIAMQYVNISLPELENHIINELQNQCNI